MHQRLDEQSAGATTRSDGPRPWLTAPWSMALLGLLAALVTSGVSQAADRDVGSGQTYPTIQAAADAASAGDVVRVHAGTYTDDVDLTSSGSSGSPITIQGDIDGDATVTGQLTVDGDYWVVRDLFFEGQTGTRPIRVRGNHNSLQGLDISGGDQDGVNASGVDNEVRGCRIYDLDSSSDAHCIVVNPDAEDWVIAENELFDCSGDGIQLYGPGGEVSRNIVNTRIEYNTIYFAGGVQRTENAIDVKNAAGLTIVGNTMYGFPDNKTMVFQKGPIDIHVECNVMHTGFTGVEFRGEDGGTIENVTFARNLMHDFESYALKFDGTENAQVFNNTFVDAQSDGLRIDGAGLEGGQVQNNLWLRTGAVESSNFTADHNGFFDVSGNDIASASDVNADPLLDSSYLLSTGSPMIDVGVDVGFDFAGAAPDIGFHEVGVDGCDPAGTAGSGGGGTGGSAGTGGSGGTGGTSSGGSSSGAGPTGPPGAARSDEGGCGCRQGHAPTSGLAGWALLGLGLLGRRRR